MKNDYSYGVIPLRFHQNEWQTLIVQHHAGHWAFPKGHAEPGEEARQAAERELQEETGLIVQRYLLSDVMTEHYIFTFQGQRISKTVKYFLALVEGQVKRQELEIQAIQWIKLAESLDHMTFKETKHLCLKVTEFLKTVDAQGNPLLA